MFFVGGETVNTLSAQHLEHGRSQLMKISLMGFLTVLVSLVALGQGSSVHLDMWTTVQIIFRDLGCIDESFFVDPSFCGGDDLRSQIIWELRFPRVLMAIVGGIGLATAGALMQGCLGNPLVSPLTLGVASGAALGAALAIVVGFSITSTGAFAIAGNAFVFSLIVVFLIIQLGRYRSILSLIHI